MYNWDEIFGKKYSNKRAIKDLIIALTLLICAAGIPFLAVEGFLMPEKETIYTWLSRSGSITVILSLFAEYGIAKAITCLNPTGIEADNIAGLRRKYEKLFKTLKVISLSLAVLGTLFWGYGDIMFT